MIENSNIEDTLQKYGSFIASPVGISMLPLIRCGKDTVLLEQVTKKPMKHDVVLYKRKNGKYVLHRLMEVRENDYVMCGDNQYIKEYGIRDENIIGIARGFYRKEKFIDPKSRGYLAYTYIWCISLRLRKFILIPVHFASRIQNFIYRKIKHVFNKKQKSA